MSPELIYRVNLASTLVMVGLIWFVQVVHYPLLARVGRPDYQSYQAAHMRRTTWVVAAPMLTEVASSVLLLWYRPATFAAPAAWLGLGLVALNWLSTVLWQVPAHERLRDGFDAPAHLMLVRTNWVRTVAWSARGCLLLAFL